MSHLSAELQLVQSATTIAATSSLQAPAQQIIVTGLKLGITGLRPVLCVNWQSKSSEEECVAAASVLACHSHSLSHSFSSIRGWGGGGVGDGLYHVIG